MTAGEAEAVTVLTEALEQIHELVTNPPWGILDQTEVKRISEDALMATKVLMSEQHKT